MITNRQYKEDMGQLLNILQIVVPHIPLKDRRPFFEGLLDIKIRLNAIPNSDEIDAFQARTEELRRTGIRPIMDMRQEMDEPHDLGNTLHIPGEDG